MRGERSETGQTYHRPQSCVMPFGTQQLRIIFKEMVKAEMEEGKLGIQKRRELIRYAAKLGLTRIEAEMIVAQVRDGNNSHDTIDWLSSSVVQEKVQVAVQARQAMRNMLIVATFAVALDLLIIHWVF